MLLSLHKFTLLFKAQHPKVDIKNMSTEYTVAPLCKEQIKKVYSKLVSLRKQSFFSLTENPFFLEKKCLLCAMPFFSPTRISVISPENCFISHYIIDCLSPQPFFDLMLNHSSKTTNPFQSIHDSLNVSHEETIHFLGTISKFWAHCHQIDETHMKKKFADIV